MPPKERKSSASTIRSPEIVRSPAPKDLKRKKSRSNAKIIFFGLLASLGLIMLACFLDYQQSKLMNHTSKLPHEVQVATKYVVDMAKEVPHKLEVLLDSAKGQIIIITGNMHIGDKTVAQLLFGVDEEAEDPTPADVVEDFKLEDEVDIDNQMIEEIDVEEMATVLRKEEELRIYEENRRKRKEEEMRVYEENRKKMKEETLKSMEAKKEAENTAPQEDESDNVQSLDEEALSNEVTEVKLQDVQIENEVSVEADNSFPKGAEENDDIDRKEVEPIDATTNDSKKYKEDEAY